MRFHELTERVVNAIGDQGLPAKKKYVDQVWQMLQTSYASIGGIKGSGFSSKEDMIHNIPFWKLIVKDGELKVVFMYKDTNGRKLVAVGTDGSRESVKMVQDTQLEEIKRSYGEKSKAALGLLMKTIPWEILKTKLIDPKDVQSISGNAVIPISDISKNKWPADAVVTLTKFPQLHEFGYLRKINNNFLFKVMYGTPNKKIK